MAISLLATCVMGCSGTADTFPEADNETDALTAGHDAPDSMERAVGTLRVNGSPYAAALVRDRKTVITACHVVHLAKPAQVTFTIPGGKTYGVDSITCLNHGTDINNVAALDVARIKLAGDGVTEVAPLGLLVERTPAPLNGKKPTVTVWGEGCKNRDTEAAHHVRQYFQFAFSLNTTDKGADGRPANDGPTVAVVCPGDSGGPYIYNGQVFAVVHDWHHTKTGFDTFARVPADF